MADRYLFKAKRKDDGEWVEGSLVVLADDDYRIATESDSRWAYKRGCSFDGCMTNIDPSTICQCTGLKDKNGNLIWENDVVKGNYWHRGESHRHIGLVKWLYSAYKVVGVKQYEGQHDELNSVYEVIGNKFDNPELLEEES